MLKIKKAVLGPIETNSYLIFDEVEKEAIIIDLGDYPSYFLKILEELKLDLKAIFFTHGHYDHIKGLEFTQNFSEQIPIYIGEKDLPSISNSKYNLSYLLGENLSYPYITPISLKEKDHFDFKNITIEIFEFPGHTPGSLGILVNENHLFSGDTIFKGTVGRTDLPGGNPLVLKETLQKIKKHFSPETIIYPGHGDKTTLKKELKLNLFL
jgi:hydroxyacylglutathione hydrolase